MTGRNPPEPTPIEARLAGPRPKLDPRCSIARTDIVDIALAANVAAASYIAPVAMTCRAPRTAMRMAAAPDARAVSELLWGEGFDLFEIVGYWGFGRSASDRYTGWVAMAALGEAIAGPGVMITARLAPLFVAPDIKAAVLDELAFGARVSGVEEGQFLALSAGGYVHRRHLASLPETPLAVARLFTGAPYLWGGRTPLGVDCSGLVQAALGACGVAAPRDSDQQREQLGRAVDFEARRGGDLVFFPGHVGMLVDADRLFHANAHWMATVEEPLADVIARGAEVIAVRRL